MARGYPSRKRARKAYWRGVKTARTGRGINPYRNAVLKDLFERGRANPGGSAGLRPKSESQPAPLSASSLAPRPPKRDSLSRGGGIGGRERGSRDPRDPMPRRRF
jgi:hypothetical protein